MRCPKCGYFSFDDNQKCPKCSKDISEEQNRLSHPAYRPSPPFLLATLTGELIETGFDAEMDQLEGPGPIEADHDITLNDPDDLEKDVSPSDEDDIEIHLDSEDPVETASPDEEGIVPEKEETEINTGLHFEEEGEGLSLELGGSSEDEPEPSFSFSETKTGEEDVALDLGDIAAEEKNTDQIALDSLEELAKEDTIELDDLALEDDPFHNPQAAPENVFDDDEIVTLDIDAKEDAAHQMEDFDLELDLDEEIEDRQS
jgi:hypothetical protein